MSSNRSIFRVTVWGIHRSLVACPRKGQWRGALVFFYLLLNKQLSKQSRRWWFETPSRSLRRQWNGGPVTHIWVKVGSGKGLVACLHQAITSFTADLSSMGICATRQRLIPQAVLKISIHKMAFKNALVKSISHFSMGVGLGWGWRCRCRWVSGRVGGGGGGGVLALTASQHSES